MPREDLIQLRGGTAAAWAAANPVLDDREPGVETDTRKIKYGDGVTAWNVLPYAAGGGGGAVDSVDGQTGVVDLSGEYDPLGAAAAAAAASQPSDPDLNAIAALGTVPYGRSLLTLASQAALKAEAAPPAASTVAPGTAELATGIETALGADGVLVVTPAGLKFATDLLFANFPLSVLADWDAGQNTGFLQSAPNAANAPAVKGAGGWYGIAWTGSGLLAGLTLQIAIWHPGISALTKEVWQRVFDPNEGDGGAWGAWVQWAI